MRKRALFLLVVFAVVVPVLTQHSTVAGGAENVKAPKRVKMDCAAYRDGMARMAKSMGIKMNVTPGSWSTIPAVLRTLPSGGELCGTVDDGAVVIVAPLFGKDIEAHYAPLFAKLGCQPFTCEVSAGLSACSCKGNDTRGRVQTDSDIEAFSLHFKGKPGK